MISQEEWETCLKVLRVLSKNPDEAKDVLVLKGLVTKLYKNAKKEDRRESKKSCQQADNLLLSKTILHQLNPLHEHQNSPILSTTLEGSLEEFKRSKSCYCCKKEYKKIHFFYHLLCPVCADFNYAKREQSSDLQGRTALITGGRVKIGYLTALRLLRDGAEVLLTTRFPKDAARRFSQESDYSTWQHRLKIYGLDLRHIPSVIHFIDYLLTTLPALDILINNAAQTIKRPLAYYQHLIDGESRPHSELTASSALLTPSPFSSFQLLEQKNVSLSQIEKDYFPVGLLDKHQQQIDKRPQNSWVLKLENVDMVEMLEVQLVNAVAPFLFNGKLKPLLLKSPFEKKFIVNVSAMEGQFGRQNKTSFHPHTNMAKASLNMLTRTAAEDYAKSGIYMNSVDTGWITQENPYPTKQKIRSLGFVPPLDEVDGMARIYDPIATGINSSETPLFGHFLKDYRPHDW